MANGPEGIVYIASASDAPSNLSLDSGIALPLRATSGICAS
jgi:hypothetical protein